MRSPLLSVASLAVDVFVGPVAGDDRVESFAAVATLVAFPVPFAALREHLFSSEHHATATWTTFARRGLDYGGVDHGRTRSSIATSRKFNDPRLCHQICFQSADIESVERHERREKFSQNRAFFLAFKGETELLSSLLKDSGRLDSNLFSFERLDSGFGNHFENHRKKKNVPCKRGARWSTTISNYDSNANEKARFKS